jgi:hypothetical protein
VAVPEDILVRALPEMVKTGLAALGVPGQMGNLGLTLL